MQASGKPAGPQYVGASSSRRIPWLWIGIVVVVLAVGGLGAAWYWVWSVTPPVEVVKTFMDAQSKLDWTAMTKCVTEKDRPELEKLAADPKVKEMTKALKGKADASTEPKPTYGETTYQDDKATVPSKVAVPAQMSAMFGGLKELPRPWVLVKEGREWKVDLKASQRAQGKAMEKAMEKVMPSMMGQPGGVPTQ